MKENDLTQGGVVKTLIAFSVPFLIANILQSLYGAVDLLVIGRFCDARSVAAVSTGTQVTQIVTSLVTGLTLGSTIVIGEYKGAGQMERVKQTIGTTLTIFAAVALLISALMLAFLRPLLGVLSTPAESFDQTMIYVAVCAAGNIFVCGYNAISAILRSYGDSTRPMLFVGVACLINIALDLLFVAVFHWDVAGVALATVIAQGVSMVCAIVYLRRRDFVFDFQPASFVPVGAIAKKLARVGVPISLQELMVRISFLYLMTVMNRCGVYAAAVVKLEPRPLTERREDWATFVQHDSIIESQRQGRTGLIAGIKKDVVITDSILMNPRSHRLALYGWHRLDGKPIQPVYTGHVDWYVDYSHGFRLVYRTIYVDGRPMDYVDVMHDDRLRPALTRDPWGKYLRYPTGEDEE